MAESKNLCAQIPIDLHNRVSQAKEEAGQTTSQYITELLIEYFKMKENGGTQIMADSSRTMAFQISEDLFQRIKAHLERETQRTGRKLTQREFVLGLIEEALNEAERQAGVSPCEAPEDGSDVHPRKRVTPLCWAEKRPCAASSATAAKQQMRGPQNIPDAGCSGGLFYTNESAILSLPCCDMCSLSKQDIAYNSARSQQNGSQDNE